MFGPICQGLVLTYGYHRGVLLLSTHECVAKAVSLLGAAALVCEPTRARLSIGAEITVMVIKRAIALCDETFSAVLLAGWGRHPWFAQQLWFRGCCDRLVEASLGSSQVGMMGQLSRLSNCKR